MKADAYENFSMVIGVDIIMLIFILEMYFNIFAGFQLHFVIFIRFLYLERKYEEIVLKGGSSRCWKRWEELTAREMTGFWLKDNKIRKQIPWQIELAAYIKCPFLSSLCLLSRTFNFNIQYLKPYFEGNVSQISHYRNALMQVNFIYHELDSHIENLYNTCSSRIFYTRV